jgi:hypothetical protein
VTDADPEAEPDALPVLLPVCVALALMEPVLEAVPEAVSLGEGVWLRVLEAVPVCVLVWLMERVLVLVPDVEPVLVAVPEEEMDAVPEGEGVDVSEDVADGAIHVGCCGTATTPRNQVPAAADAMRTTPVPLTHLYSAVLETP